MDSIADIKKKLGHVNESKQSPDMPIPVVENKPEVTVTEQALANSKESSAVKDPIGMAAMNFGLYFPEFKKRVMRMSRKSTARLLIAIMGHPLEAEKINLNREDEKQAFAIAQGLADSKLVLILDSLYKRHKEIDNATKPPTEAEMIAVEVEKLKKEKEELNNEITSV